MRIHEHLERVERGLRYGHQPGYADPVLIDSESATEVVLPVHDANTWGTIQVDSLQLPSIWRRFAFWRRIIGGHEESEATASSQSQRLTRLVSLISNDSQVWELRKNQDNGHLTVWVGRDGDNDLPIDDVTISAYHAHVTVKRGRVSLSDCESANGTFVNRQRLTPLTGCELHDGDCVRLGSRVLYFLDGPRLRQLLKLQLAKRLAQRANL